MELGALFFSCLVAVSASAQTGVPSALQKIPLTVPAGVPLRLYLTKRVPKRAGAPVEAKLLEPVYAFDREVIPAGTVVLGKVSRVTPFSRSERTRAVAGGDFTPLRKAKVQFTTLVLPDGRRIPIRTVETAGLHTLVPYKRKKDQPVQDNTGGMVAKTKQKIKNQVHTGVERVKSIPDVVRAPDKKERIYDYLMAKLPYHPQYFRKGTRFDAELRDPLRFGTEAVTQGSLVLLGTQPPAGSIVHTRLITPLDSGSSKMGESVVAALTAPLFSHDHKLLLPEGTRLEGSVVLVRKARWFHRGGRLRFNFRKVDLPPEVADLRWAAAASDTSAGHQGLQYRTEASLKAAESSKAPVKVDSEGGVQAKDSKKRFLGTAAAVLIARSAADNDAGRARMGAGQGPNTAGRTLGGGLGFGLLGAIAARSSPIVGSVFGFYGMGWSVYSTVVARGSDVQFARNAVLDIGFNARPSQPPKPHVASRMTAGRN